MQRLAVEAVQTTVTGRAFKEETTEGFFS